MTGKSWVSSRWKWRVSSSGRYANVADPDKLAHLNPPSTSVRSGALEHDYLDR